MPELEKIVDLTYMKSPLAVRQNFAVLLGLPLDREFTWAMLEQRMHSVSDSLPKRLLFRGISNLALTVPDEATLLRAALKKLKEHRPDLEILFELH